jgi:hypothetical protein
MTGRDPLGLSRVSYIITDFLLTGIITQTDRARYYSFYCWAIWHINKNEILKKYDDFVSNFQKRESFMALSTISQNRDTSPVGVTAVTSQLDKASEAPTVNCDFRVLPSNSLGGYGQYYGGSLYQLGLTKRNESGIDEVSDGLGKQLAESFHESIKNSPYIKEKAYQGSSVSLDILHNTQKFISLDAIWDNFSINERAILTDLFFGLQKNKNERSLMRCHTLGMVLHIISEYNKNSIKISTKNLDMYLVYPTYNHSEIRQTDSTTLHYSPPRTFEFCFSVWRQFCVQQLFTQATETLMYAVLESAGSQSDGLALKEMIQRLTQDEFEAFFKETIGGKCQIPKNMFESFNIDEIPTDEISLRIQRDLSFYNPKSEAQILNLKAKNPSAAAAKSMMLFAILYLKWRGVSKDNGFIYLSNYVENEMWVGSIFPYLDQWFDAQTTWEDALTVLIQNLIINQHDRIMYEKRRLDACWLHMHEGRVFKDQDYGARWRSSRHWNVISILRDLRLLKFSADGDISITTDGEKILKRLIEG